MTYAHSEDDINNYFCHFMEMKERNSKPDIELISEQKITFSVSEYLAPRRMEKRSKILEARFSQLKSLLKDVLYNINTYGDVEILFDFERNSDSTEFLGID